MCCLHIHFPGQYRPSQAEFVCQRCGHTDNADHNAAVVIATRGIKKLLSGDPLTKPYTIDKTGEIASYQLSLGTKKFPVGVIRYVAHRPHGVPLSIHIAVEGGHWWLSFAAEDAEVTMPEKTADAATEQIAEDLRKISSTYRPYRKFTSIGLSQV